MPREYRYRRFVHWMRHVLASVAGLILLLWAGVLVAWCLDGQERGRDFFTADSLAELISVSEWPAIVLLEVVAVWYLYYRFAGVRIVVEDSAVVYRYRGGEKRLPFDDRLSVTFGFIPYVGGACVI